MNGNLTKELNVLVSHCDSTSRLGIPQTFALCMDLAQEHAEQLGNGVPEMIRRGLFWVAVKTKLRFYRRPSMAERITAATWPEPPGRMRGDRDYLLTAKGETLIEGKTEWSILDTKNGGLHSPREHIYDEALVFCTDQCCPEPYRRFHGEFPDPPFSTYTVRPTDIDMGGHMNNTAYVRMLADLFPVAQWNELDPREIEVHYRAACYEGDTLLLQKRNLEGKLELRAGLEDGTTILLARITPA